MKWSDVDVERLIQNREMVDVRGPNVSILGVIVAQDSDSVEIELSAHAPTLTVLKRESILLCHTQRNKWVSKGELV